ncbi:hypothetical protein [Paenibacillus graminis]|uniref:Uncharacterized protein n=1 Tax=Paenibacillus graminis TaxID=189425 RepID=A0A089M8B8_9BACL|nr:hypothetical protein [Paenibacillus graminis]AIQ69482.1 hypothetical protein PGRAT_18920 [Paenibacillus graminis]
MGEKKIENLNDTPPIISFNDKGQKVVKYQRWGLKITGVIINQPSDEAIEAANKLYNEMFYKFNPQEDL